MSLKKYAELGHVHRTEPCQEYPGQWMLYLPLPFEGEKEWACESLEEARKLANRIMMRWEGYPRVNQETGKWECSLPEEKQEYSPTDISICWKCSDNDPRVGQVWFTGFYQHGKFNIFGEYKPS